jgi:hypothetical protein
MIRRTFMTREELIHTLKDDLKVRKEVIGVKTMKEVPRDIPQCEGQAIPGNVRPARRDSQGETCLLCNEREPWML